MTCSCIMKSFPHHIQTAVTQHLVTAFIFYLHLFHAIRTLCIYWNYKRKHCPTPYSLQRLPQQMLCQKCYCYYYWYQWLTSITATSCNFPEYQAQSIDIGSLERLKLSTVYGLVEHFGSHVSASADTVVWSDVNWSCVDIVLNSKSCMSHINGQSINQI